MRGHTDGRTDGRGWMSTSFDPSSPALGLIQTYIDGTSDALIWLLRAAAPTARGGALCPHPSQRATPEPAVGLGGRTIC